MKTLEDVLEEITPTPDPDFVADMEWRMRQGFPPKRPRRLPRIDLAGFRPRAAAAVAASALLALAVTFAVIGDGDGDPERPVAASLPAQEEPQGDFSGHAGGGGGQADSGVTGATESKVREANRRLLAIPTQTEDVAVSPPSGGGGAAPGARVRRVERSAGMTLASDPAEFDDISDSIFRTVARHDGFVLQSSFTQGEGGEESFSSGFFELRVPAAQLQQTLNDLSGIATVRARTESGTDVTAPFVSTRDRLRTAKALRTSLLNRLEVAFTDTAIDALRRRLEIVGNRITRLREDLRGMRERTEFATVMVELVDEDTGGAPSGETDDAIDDAVGSLEDMFNFLIRAAGILVPLGLVAAIGWLAVARARRRARERALA